MRKKLRHVTRYTGYLFALLIFLFMLTISAARIIFAQMSHNKAEIEKWASEVLQQPVKMKRFHATFHGLQPVFKFRDVTVYNDAKTKEIAHLDKLNIGIDIFDSIIQRRITPGELLLSGIHLTLIQGADGKIQFNGMWPGHTTTPSSFDDLLEWLLTPGNKSVSKVELTWQGNDGRSYQFHDVKLDLKSGVGKHLLQAGFKFGAHGDPVNIVIALDGNVLAKQFVSGKLYCRTAQLHLPDCQLKNVFGFHVHDGIVRGEVWMNWHGHLIDQVQSNIQAEQLQFQTPQQKELMTFEKWRAKLAWLRSKTGWNLKLNDTVVSHDEIDQSTSIDMHSADLATLANILLATDKLPPTSRDMIMKANPLGKIDHLHLLFNDKVGSAKFTVADNQFSAPKLLKKPLHLEKVIGELNWQNEEDGLHIDVPSISLNLNEKTPEGQLEAASAAVVRLWIPKKGDPTIDLQMGFQTNKIDLIKRYLPEHIMHPHLVTWLQESIQGGGLNTGAVILRGKLKDFPFDHAKGRFIARSDVNDLQLKFQPTWPMLTHCQGSMIFDNRSMNIHLSSGRIDNNPITSIDATITDLEEPFLFIDGLINSTGQAGTQFLSQCPLKDTIGKELNDLHLQGQLTLDLQLGIYLNKKTPTTVKGLIDWKNGVVELSNGKIKAKNVNGEVSFTEKGVFANRLKAMVMDQPISFSLATINTNNDKSRVTQVGFNGRVNIDNWRQYLPTSVFQDLQGTTDVSGHLQLHHNHQADEFVLMSELSGITSQLPEPLNKSTLSVEPVKLTMHFNQGTTQVQFGYHDKIQASLKKSKAGLQLTGHITRLDWDRWQSHIFQKVKAGDINTDQVNVDCSVDDLLLLGQTLKNAKIKLVTVEAGHDLKVTSDKINGIIHIPNEFPKLALQANFSQLVISDPMPKFNHSFSISDIPPLNLDIHDFYYHGMALGHAQLSLTPDYSTLHINQLMIQGKTMQINATGAWQNLGKFQQTTLTGSLHSDNLGLMLKQFDLNETLIGGKGFTNFTLTWFDSLFKPSVADMSGKFNLHFHDGQIIKLSAAARERVGIGRVLNLLSLESLPRRLKGDFSDLTKSGFVFDEMSGDFIIREGNAYTKNAFIQGPVAKVAVNGRMGLSKKDYRLVLSISPYVTSSLPVVATIAGGPAVGAATWLADKVLSKVVKRVTTVNYNVRGSWSQPEVVELPAPL